MNTLTLAVFAPILVIVGILGFVVPPDKAATSGAPLYNVFHIVFGLTGIAFVVTGNDAAIRDVQHRVRLDRSLSSGREPTPLVARAAISLDKN